MLGISKATISNRAIMVHVSYHNHVPGQESARDQILDQSLF